MKHAGYAAYSVAEHERVQLGIHEIECQPEDDRPGISVRFAITANLVSTNAPVLKTKALDAIHRGHAYLAIDLATCPYVDATGIGVLVTLANATRRRGGGLTIEHANDDLRTLFDLTGVSKRFTLSPEVSSR